MTIHKSSLHSDPTEIFTDTLYIIDDQTSSVTFDSFDLDHHKLIISGTCASCKGGLRDTICLRFNDDGETNYSSFLFLSDKEKDATTLYFNAESSLRIGFCNADAYYPMASFNIEIPFYSIPTPHSIIASSGGIDHNYRFISTSSGAWDKEVPITSVTLFLQSGAKFSKGSRFFFQLL